MKQTAYLKDVENMGRTMFQKMTIKFFLGAYGKKEILNKQLISRMLQTWKEDCRSHVYRTDFL